VIARVACDDERVVDFVGVAGKNVFVSNWLVMSVLKEAVPGKVLTEPVLAVAPGADVEADQVTLERFAEAVILPLLPTKQADESVGVVGVPTVSWYEEMITELELCAVQLAEPSQALSKYRHEP